MSDIRLIVEDGDSIQSVVDVASKVAKAIGKTLSFKFNELQVVVGPAHSPEVVVQDYIKRVTIYRRGDD